MLKNPPLPTPYPEVNALLDELLRGVRAVLGSHLLAFYLDGSLATGDFDPDSDIDFVAVTDHDLSPGQFAALLTLHDRLSTLDTWCAIQLEGWYVSARVLRRYDPAMLPLPNLERGLGERLKYKQPGESWRIHQQVLREHGIVLAGPPPQALIDPVLPDELRHSVHSLLPLWPAPLLQDASSVDSRGNQSYLVLTLCRMLYTLEFGAVASKPAAARWAQQTLPPAFTPLIERSWDGRHHPDQPPDLQDMTATLELIRYTIKKAG